MTTIGKKPPGRPRDAAKGLAILDAGWALFLQHGVDATPIEAIARKAGVSKVTLYSHYPDKTALFRAAVQREMTRIEAAQIEHGSARETIPVAGRLSAFGLGIMGFLLSKPAVDFYSVVAGELRRHDDLARAFYDLGPGQTHKALAALIADATTRGELAATNATQAAEDLFGLWQGFTNFQISLGVDVLAMEQDLPARVARSVALFMAVHGPKRPAASPTVTTN